MPTTRIGSGDLTDGGCYPSLVTIAADYSTGPVPIHFMSPWRPVSRGGVVICLSKDLSTSATADPRFVTCGACLQLVTERQREKRTEQVRRYG